MPFMLDSPIRRRKEHHCLIMYRLSKIGGNIDEYRPAIRLRNRKKVKFNCGVKLWDMIPDGIQRSITKVKFRTLLKSVPL